MVSTYKTVLTVIIKYEFELLLFVFLTIKLFKHYVSLANGMTILPRYAAVFLILAVFSYAVGGVLRRSEAPFQRTLVIFVSLVTVSYVSNSALLLDTWFRNADVFRALPALLLSIFAPVLMGQKRLKWLLPPLAFLSAAILPVFVFTFFPFVWLSLRYAKVKAATPAEYNDLSASTLIATTLGFLLFGMNKVFLPGVDLEKTLNSNINAFAFSFVAVLPLVIFASAFWITCVSVSDNKSLKRVFLITAVLPLIGVVWICMDNSPVNPLMTAVSAQMGLLLVAVDARDGTVMTVLAKTQKVFRSRGFCLFLLLLCAVYLSLFSGYAKEIFAGYTQSKTYFALWR